MVVHGCAASVEIWVAVPPNPARRSRWAMSAGCGTAAIPRRLSPSHSIDRRNNGANLERGGSEHAAPWGRARRRHDLPRGGATPRCARRARRWRLSSSGATRAATRARARHDDHCRRRRGQAPARALLRRAGAAHAHADDRRLARVRARVSAGAVPATPRASSCASKTARARCASRHRSWSCDARPTHANDRRARRGCSIASAPISATRRGSRRGRRPARIARSRRPSSRAALLDQRVAAGHRQRVQVGGVLGGAGLTVHDRSPRSTTPPASASTKPRSGNSRATSRPRAARPTATGWPCTAGPDSPAPVAARSSRAGATRPTAPPTGARDANPPISGRRRRTGKRRKPADSG